MFSVYDNRFFVKYIVAYKTSILIITVFIFDYLILRVRKYYINHYLLLVN